MTGYRFICGADMDPTAIRAAWPGARFVARARLGERWGILLSAPLTDADRARPEREVITDDGRAVLAHADETPAGDDAGILAAARYWELPPAYVRTLAGFEEPAETR